MSQIRSFGQRFQNFLGAKYSKQFHMIDNPAVVFSLACKKADLSDFSHIEQTEIHKSKHLSFKQRSKVRNFYELLREEANKMMKCIYSALESKSLVSSQFFEYEQVVVGGFMSGFIDHLKVECKQKGQLLEFLWKENIKLVYTLLQYYQREDFKSSYEKDKELKEFHEKYEQYLRQNVQKQKKQSQQILVLKDMIELLVEKLRVRRKQVKKLFKQTQHLMSVVNEFKDKNIQLQMKYISLLEENQNKKNNKQVQELSKKKQQLNLVFNQILTLESSLYTNLRPFLHEVYLEGPLRAEDFIKQATGVIHGPGITNQEVKAEIDVMLDKYEQDFEDILMRFKKVNKKKNINEFIISETSGNIEKQQQITIKTFQNQSTQVTFNQQIQALIIKNVGTSMEQTRKINHENKKIQVNCKDINRENFQLYRIIEMQISHVKQSEFKIVPLMAGDKRQSQTIEYVDDNQIEDKKSTGFAEDDIKIIERRRNSSKRMSGLQKKTRKDIKSRFSLVENYRKSTEIRIKENEVNMIQQEQANAIIDAEKDQIKEKNKRGSKLSGKRSLSSIQKERKFSSKKSFSKLEKNYIQKLDDKFQSKGEITNLRQKEKGKKKLSQFARQEKERDNRVSQKTQQNELNLHPQDELALQERSKHTIKEIIKYAMQLEKSEANQKGGYIQNIITRLIEIKRADNKNYLKPSPNYPSQFSIDRIKQSIQSKLKEYINRQRKSTFHIKHKNIFQIISSVYNRAFHRYKENIQLKNFMDPLYESMMVLYGTLTSSHSNNKHNRKQSKDINKKITNFIVQVISQKSDPICRTFLFFLGLDDSDHACQSIIPFDLNLHFKLIEQLSCNQKPFEDLYNSFTNILKIRERLPKILQDEKFPLDTISQILKRFEFFTCTTQAGQLKPRYFSNPSEELSQLVEKKINLLYCSKQIVKLIITLRNNLKSLFQNFVSIFTPLCNSENRQEICEKALHQLLMIVSQTRVRQLQNEIAMQKICKWKGFAPMNMDQYAFRIIGLGIVSLEDLYVKILRKFSITSEKKRQTIMSYETPKILQSQKPIANEQIREILVLAKFQEAGNKVLQEIFGAQLVQLYAFSILALYDR